jgi:DNA modification methylase
MQNKNDKFKIVYVPIDSLKAASYNPRRVIESFIEKLMEGIKQFKMVDPIIVNSAPNRKNIIVGGHMRVIAAKRLGMKTVPVVYVNIPDIAKEKELNLRLNRVGEWDFELLAKFDADMLEHVGFSDSEIDEAFGIEDTPEQFNLERELRKLNIDKIVTKKGDIWQIGPHKIICGDSTIETDVLKLMGDERADMCFTDPPYLLNYLKGKKKRNGKVTEGFGLKRDRIYLGTESLPENFTDLWMANIAKIQKSDFSIIVYENPKNLRTIWNALEKHWRYRNTIIWHVPNRVQGFSAKYKFFNKSDIALVGSSGKVGLNLEPESDELFQSEYETAIYAISGKPQWEGYERGKKYCPTDFIEHVAADEKSSGQGIIFGTKPVEILIPYIKVLTKRNDLIIEPFCGSGSTIVSAHKLGRRCYAVEKSPIYAEVAKARIAKLLGIKPVKIHAA